MRQCRERRGYTLEALAKVSGVSGGLISQIENQDSAGSPVSLQKTADALSISVGTMLEMEPRADHREPVRTLVPHKDRILFERVFEAVNALERPRPSPKESVSSSEQLDRKDIERMRRALRIIQDIEHKLTTRRKGP